VTTIPAVVCAGCGLVGHAKATCPDRKILRIPAFVDSDPIPFYVTMPESRCAVGS
jgi:hypothetical protein